ncbi:hypothetical protein Cni_G17834 [Canna indica]|uniref:Cytochrome P450 711A1 n=1 Tax=Canna indica TaxID=4628 RepID=A0AAQ3QDW0_9LILI|nr:hypothetical protein Cni_G17834 [Canna indica]
MGEGSLSGVVSNVESLAMSYAPFFLLSGAFLLGFLVYFYEPYWRVRKVPGPPSAFLVGHLPLLAKHGPDILIVFAKNYGPIFRFHMGRQPLVIVANAELCRQVGIKNFKDIRNRSSPSPASGLELLQKGLFLTRDSRWSSTRNLITSLYQPSHLAGLIPTMHRYINSFSDTIAKLQQENDGDIPFSELSLRLAIDVIGKTAFGIEFGLLNESSSSKDRINDVKNGGGDDASAFLKQHTYSVASLKMDLSSSFSTVLGLVAPVLQKPCREILRRVPGTADHKLQRTNEKLCDRIDAIIAKRSKEMTRESKDLLAALLNARDAGIARYLLSNSYVRALSYEHLIAGTKTTAFTLSMTVYLVSQHPEVERKLVEEIDRFGPRDVVPTADDLHCKFPYLDQVIKESMRLYTVSPLVARETSQQVEIGGYVLPKGTWVWLALGVVAKDPKQFPAPDMFRPERFDPACDEEKRRHPYSHIPFGIGPRACIGQKFAIQEIKLSLIHLYRHYVFRQSPKMELPPEFEYGLVLGFKRDIKLRAINRPDN